MLILKQTLILTFSLFRIHVKYCFYLIYLFIYLLFLWAEPGTSPPADVQSLWKNNSFTCTQLYPQISGGYCINTEYLLLKCFTFV